jgi:hypothetical protein
MSVSSRSTTVVCRQQIVLMLSTKMGYHVCFSVSVCTRIIENKATGPCPLPGRLTAQRHRNFPEPALSGLLEDVCLVAGQNLWFELDGSHLWRCPVMVERDILVTMKEFDVEGQLHRFHGHWINPRWMFSCFGYLKQHSRAVPPSTIENIVAEFQMAVTTTDARTLRRVRQNVMWCISV